jgi:hypothetical protein
MNLRTATLQRLLLLATGGLAIAYLTLVQPIARRVVAEDAPIADLRQRLERATLEAGLARDTSFESLAARLGSLRSSADALSAAVREALPRLEHPDETRARLEEPFQLFAFLNESQRRLDEIGALAQAAKVTVTPGLATGLPTYKQELARPELLWVQLATLHRVVRTAIRAGVREIREVSVEPLPLAETAEFGPALPPTAATPPQGTNRWTTLRVHLTTVGSVDALGKLLLAVALTPEELKRTGLPAELAGQPALFLERFLLRRNQLDAAEQAQLELVVATVVPNEEP